MSERVNPKPIIGQEAICPDGLGRVSDIEFWNGEPRTITVVTYHKNRSCGWAAHNVELLDPRRCSCGRTNSKTA